MQIATQITGRPMSQPGRSQPSGGAPGASSERIGSSGAGGGASGPNPIRPASVKTANTTGEPAARTMAISSGVIDSDPTAIGVSRAPTASAPKKTAAPTDRRGRHAEAHLVVGPGDRMDDGDDHGQQGSARP